MQFGGKKNTLRPPKEEVTRRENQKKNYQGRKIKESLLVNGLEEKHLGDGAAQGRGKTL